MVVKLIFINTLTLIRILGTIILVPVYRRYGGLAVGIVSLFCYFTDSIDGILARKLHASTFFGALFDGLADKLFTIINFIVLFLITPYAIIPIIFEILTMLVLFIKYQKNLNVKSNIIGKSKIWVLAISLVITFLISDINNIPFLPINFKDFIGSINPNTLYIVLLLPAIIMEFLTFSSYLMELFNPKQKLLINNGNKNNNVSKFKGTFWENFKNIWLNPDYYEQHKNDNYLRKITKVTKESK